MIGYEDNQLPKNIEDKLTALGAMKTGSRAMLDRYFMDKPMAILTGEQVVSDDPFDLASVGLASEHSSTFFFSDELTTIDNKTDWDYAIQYSEENIRRVMEAFDHRGNYGSFITDYADVNSVGCFSTKLWSKSSIWDKPKEYHIQIIFKKDMDMYKAIWNSIDLEYYASFLWKKSKHYKAWNVDHVSAREFIKNHFNAMYRTYKAGQSIPTLGDVPQELENQAMYFSKGTA